MVLIQKEAIVIAVVVGIASAVLINWLIRDNDKDKDKDCEATSSSDQHKRPSKALSVKTEKIEENENIEEKTTFGEMQSPIDILSSPKSGKTKIMKDDEFKSNPLRFRYPSQITDCTILNNGHTVQINIPSHSKCELSINNKIYSLKQFHFHTPSEHLFDSNQLEMEMHLVHINEANEIAVLGFLFTSKQKRIEPKLKFSESRMHVLLSKDDKVGKVGNTLSVDKESSDDFDTDDEWDEEKDGKDKDYGMKKKMVKKDYGKSKKGNDFLAQFWDELPKEKTEKDIPLKNALSFEYLFETSSDNFKKTVKTNEMEIDMELFEYTGSLTTPPYTEGVQWLVSKTTHFINNQQLWKLSACWGHECNARPVQEYHGRTVVIRKKSRYDVVDA